MSRIDKWLAVAALLSSASVLLALLTPSALATAVTKCPGQGTPPPGSTINGGLEITGGVDGYCELHDVTVTGGIVVDPTPDAMLAQGHWNAVNLIGSIVSGGVVVGHNSEVDANVDFSTFSVTPDRTTISGGLAWNTGLTGIVVNTTINGAASVNGSGDVSPLCDPAFCWGNHVFCDVRVNGNVTISDINGSQDVLGDPSEQQFSNSNCKGTTIHGSVYMRDSNFTRPSDGEPSEIEGNTISGSVHLDHSTLELNGNTIGGSLLCTNGTVIHAPAPGDATGNVVRGSDTCD